MFGHLLDYFTGCEHTKSVQFEQRRRAVYYPGEIQSYRKYPNYITGIRFGALTEELAREMVRACRAYADRWKKDHELFVCGGPFPKEVAAVAVGITLTELPPSQVQAVLRHWRPQPGERVSCRDRQRAAWLTRAWRRRLGLTNLEVRRARQLLSDLRDVPPWHARACVGGDIEFLIPGGCELVTYREWRQ